jgi:Beta-propeller repeat
MKLVGANPNPNIVGTDELPGKSSYFIGNDPKKWRTNVPNYAKVKYASVYPGVDLAYYGNQGQLEYDFVVQPGADPSHIVLDVGAGLVPAQGGHPQGVPLHVDHGDLVVGTDGGEVIFHKPVVYQLENELRTKNEEPRTTNKKAIDGKYALNGSRITFEVGSYDKTRPLVIDPVLTYSAVLPGGRATALAIDASGNAYVTGTTDSADFPTTPGAFQTTPGGPPSCFNADICGDAFVSKLNAFGSALVYSTYLGGSGYDGANGIAVDASGNAYLTGQTWSPDFPTTVGAFQTTYGGGGDAFISKLNAAGSDLAYSTYLGGGDADAGSGIAIDASGKAYVTGATSSSNFPTTPGAFQTTYGGNGDAFVTKLNATGSALPYSTYLGGSGGDGASGIAVDPWGRAYVTGGAGAGFPTTPGAFQTPGGGGFVTKLNPTGSALVYSTSSIGGFAIALDGAGNAYLTGGTWSSNFPTTPGAFQTTQQGEEDAFVSKLDASGSALLYSTRLDGTMDSEGSGIGVDASGNAYVTGVTISADFPTTPGAFQTTFIWYTGGECGFSLCWHAFVTKLNAAGSGLLYSTYLEGSYWDSGKGLTVDASGSAYVTGSTGSPDFPVTQGESSEGAFIGKFSLGQPEVSLTPANLSFPAQPLGTFSAVQQATLRNTGGAALHITSISRSGDFYESNNCPALLAAGGASCTLSVRFTPTSSGADSGTVTIWDNAPGSPHKLPLTGIATGTGSVILQLSSTLLNFGSVAVGTTSSPQTVTLTNIGTAAASFVDPFGFGTTGTNWSDFHKDPHCGASLAPKASCTVSVYFKPLASGARTAFFGVRQGAASVQIPLSGTGTS